LKASHLKTGLRFLRRKILRFEVVIGTIIFLVAVMGAFLVSVDSFRVSAIETSEVVAKAEFSTGTVQGSKDTFARYSFKGQEFNVLATGGPYFKGDEIVLTVDPEGKVIVPQSMPLALMKALMGFLMSGSIAFVVWLTFELLFDRI